MRSISEFCNCRLGLAMLRTGAIVVLAALALTTVSSAASDEQPVDDERPLLDPVERSRIQGLVHAMRDDDVAWNAEHAFSELWSLDRKAAPWLRLALLSNDRQQRQHAAALLRRLGEKKGERADPPSEMLLRACVEALEDDGHCLMREGETLSDILAMSEPSGETLTADENRVRRRFRGVDLSNATDTLSWFLDDHERIRMAAPILAGQLASPDLQASFLSAYLLARIGGGAWRDRIVPMMIASLADNDISGDAVLATQALAWMGPEILPDLRLNLLKIDVQAELLLRHVIAFTAGPDDPDGVTLSNSVLWDIGIELDPIRRLIENPDRRPSVPRFPSTWLAVPFRGTLELLPVSVD